MDLSILVDRIPDIILPYSGYDTVLYIASFLFVTRRPTGVKRSTTVLSYHILGFALKKFGECSSDLNFSKNICGSADFDPEGALPIMDYTGRLRPKEEAGGI